MDKHRFMKKLHELLRNAGQTDIKDMYFKNDDTVEITFTNGHIKEVNVAGDSRLAIIQDVVNKLM